MDVGNLEADMMLPAGRVLCQEAMDRAVLAIGLDQLDLAVGRVDEADPHALGRQIEGLVDLRRAKQVAVERDALLDRGGGDTDVVQTADDHICLRAGGAQSPSRRFMSSPGLSSG